MQDFVRIDIAGAAENPWVGQGALYRVIGGGQRRAKSVQGKIQRVYPAGVQGVERGRTFDNMLCCALIAARSVRVNVPAAKSKAARADFAPIFAPTGFQCSRPVIIR